MYGAVEASGCVVRDGEREDRDVDGVENACWRRTGKWCVRQSRHGFGMEREREGEVRVWKGPGQRVEDWRCVFFARWVV
jgi:hypothetical protein